MRRELKECRVLMRNHLGFGPESADMQANINITDTWSGNRMKLGKQV